MDEKDSTIYAKYFGEKSSIIKDWKIAVSKLYGLRSIKDRLIFLIKSDLENLKNGERTDNRSNK